MAGKILDLTEQNFKETISSGVTLVDFWAPWCSPCRMQGTILEKVAEKVDGRAKVTKLNVDEGAQVAGKYGIRSIPTLLVFNDGELVQQFVGVQSEAQLLSTLELALSA